MKLTLRLIANLRKNLQGEYGILVNTYSRMKCQLNGKAFTIESVEWSTVYRRLGNLYSVYRLLDCRSGEHGELYRRTYDKEGYILNKT